MMSRLWAFFLLFSLNLTSLGALDAGTSGVLDLRSWDFQKDPVQMLDGTWLFSWKEFIPPQEVFQAPRGQRQVPQAWYVGNLPPGETTHFGWATYGLKILLPPGTPPLGIKVPVVGTSYKLYVQGNLIGQAGQPGTSAQTSKPEWKSQVYSLPPGVQTLEVVIHVSDFFDLTSGLNLGLTLGVERSLLNLGQQKLSFDFFVFGALLIMALYHLGLFIFRPKDLSPLFFSLLCFLLSWRGFLYEELYILQVWPQIPWDFMIRLGYWNYALAVGAFGCFLHFLFPHRGLPQAPGVIGALVLIYSLIVAFAPVVVFSDLLMYFHLVTLGSSVYGIWVLVRAIRSRENGAIPVLAGFVLVIFAALNDILRTMIAFQTVLMAPVGLLVFLLFQSLVMTRKFTNAFTAAEAMTQYLHKLNESFERFVPKEVLSFLSKQNITEITLGDHTEKPMAVLFIDIRDFTSLSEQMTPKENFNFLNSYLKRMVPFIRDNHGFVDKFMGDGIMALFPGGAECALFAAVNILEELERYNQDRSKAGYAPIRVAMGLHCGALLLGTIGENLRMDSTVISDAVNLASRMETLAKARDLPLVVTEEAWNQIPHPERFEGRFLGQEKIKGKSQTVGVWAVEGRRKTGEAGT